MELRWIYFLFSPARKPTNPLTYCLSKDFACSLSLFIVVNSSNWGCFSFISRFYMNLSSFISYTTKHYCYQNQLLFELDSSRIACFQGRRLLSCSDSEYLAGRLRKSSSFTRVQNFFLERRFSDRYRAWSQSSQEVSFWWCFLFENQVLQDCSNY